VSKRCVHEHEHDHLGTSHINVYQSLRYVVAVAISLAVEPGSRCATLCRITGVIFSTSARSLKYDIIWLDMQGGTMIVKTRPKVNVTCKVALQVLHQSTLVGGTDLCENGVLFD